MPPKEEAPGALSGELADLLNKKIREFEQSNAQENEKTQKAQKGKARAIAKTKLKEAKQLVQSTEVAGSEKVKSLWERLRSEHEEVAACASQAQGRLQEICDTDTQRDGEKGELGRALSVKGKLESLCRQLQTQTSALAEERRRLTEAERQRRQDLADEFQHAIGDVKKKMDQQANERSRLARENEDLRSKFRDFFEQYDRREQELLEQQRTREAEVQAFEARLAEQANLYRQEATKEVAAQRENEELNNTEQVLRGQLQTYSNKFSNFQDALSKSDKVLGQYKRQRNKMQRRVELLEKENTELRARNGKRLVVITKERDSLLKEKESFQERCSALQNDRKRLLEEVQEASAGGA